MHMKTQKQKRKKTKNPNPVLSITKFQNPSRPTLKEKKILFIFFSQFFFPFRLQIKQFENSNSNPDSNSNSIFSHLFI